MKTNIKRVLRHTISWCLGHLLVNGDRRLLMLFGGLMIWAKLQVLATNKRDSKRVVLNKVALNHDVITVLGGALVFTVLIFVRPYLTKVAIV